jgi:hypothetical protein
MWTLVLFTMLTNPTGGAHSTVTTLSFGSMQECEAVARALAETGTTGETTDQKKGSYKVWGKCIYPNGKPQQNPN